MASRLNPYIGFKDNARQAMEFYKEVFGGELRLNTFGEFGAQDSPEANKIMHAQLKADNGITFMAADTPSGMDVVAGSQITMALMGDDDAELSDYFQQLADGGTVTAPLEPAPWGDKFGMLTDRFGISWMVNISGPQSQGQPAT